MGHLTSTPNNTRHDLSISILLTALLTLTWLIYQPAIPGFFMLDDFDNLAALKGGVHDIPTLKDFLETGKAGKLGRPIAKLTFLINDNAWPSNPESFKQTNLLIHLLIGVILFCFARLALQPFMLRKQGDWVALIATGIWLVHPFHVSTVSYIVQRMAQLSSLFIIIAASIHLYMRLKYPALYTRHLIWLSISLVIIGSLAAFSKENGVLLPIYILVIEFTILSSNLPSRNFIWWRRVFIILPSIVLLSYIAYIPRWIGSYASRDFTLGERLLTEPVILLDYLTRFFTVRVHKLGLFQDDYPIYHNLLDVRALGSLLLILIVISSAVCFRKKYPIYAFGVLWFFAGHILESTTVSLELYFEHRNYLPLFGPVLAFTALFYLGIKRFSKDLSRVSPIFGALIISIASLTTWGYANEWGNPLRLFPIWSVEHPESPRAQRTYAHILASEGLPNAALDVLDSAYDQFPYDLSIPLMSINISCSFGSPLRYDLKSLALQIERYRITDGLRPALESLFENINDSKCQDKINDLHNLIPALFKLDKNNSTKKLIAAAYVLDGNLYMKEGKGNDALRSYKIIEKLAPSKDSMLRLAGFYLIVKDFDMAKNALLEAKRREDSSTRWFKYSRSAEYQEKLHLIEKLKKEHAQRVINNG